jgi:hypothetical protein
MPSVANHGAPQTGPILDVHLIAGFANRMIQYMVARRISAEVRGCRISNVALPEWGINHPVIEGGLDPSAKIPISRNDLDVAEIVRQLSSGDKTRADFKSYAQWFPNFPDIDFSREIFPANQLEYPGFGSEFLTCHVRGGDIVNGRHGNYVLLPIKFYEELAEMTGLKLAFLGQIEDNLYCNALKQRFPDATFCEGQTPLADFQTLRNSRNLAIAVSTFSWLAAWLSHADMIIFPINGILNPAQCPAVDLLPYPDKRYRFYLFPKNFAVPLNQLEASHRALQGCWREVPMEMIPEIRASVHRSPAQYFDQFLSLFDEEFYLRNNLDVARVVKAGRLASGLDHYVAHGFSEGRPGFAFDERWYRDEYPEAATEVECGKYPSLVHHFVLVGNGRGYKPLQRRAVLPRK